MNRHGSQAHKLRHLITRGGVVSAASAKALGIPNIWARLKEIKDTDIAVAVVTQHDRKPIKLYAAPKTFDKLNLTHKPYVTRSR
jgi:hypothetical protein